MRLNRIVCASVGALAALVMVFAWVVLTGKAIAGPDDLLLNQRNSTDTGNIQRIPAHPTTNWGVLSYDNTALLPSWLTFGPGFSINSGVLDVVSSSPTINDNPGRSLATTTSSTGFQISATKNAKVCYEGSFSTTSTIGGPASASVFIETADTNSTTPGDWTTKARQTYSNTITLAIVLNQVQGNNWSMCRDIPAGKFVRIRSGSISGTASVSINSEQQEVTY